MTYSNNLKPMLLLSVLFRMALLMDVSPFYFCFAAECNSGDAGGMCLWLSCGTEWGYLLEISDPACLCISASDVGDDCRVLYGFHELRYGNPGTGFPEIGGSIRGKRRQILWALFAAGMAVLAGTWEDHSDHTADRMRCDPLVAEVSVDRRVTLLFGGFVVILGSGSAALGQFPTRSQRKHLKQPIL